MGGGGGGVRSYVRDGGGAETDLRGGRKVTSTIPFGNLDVFVLYFNRLNILHFILLPYFYN